MIKKLNEEDLTFVTGGIGGVGRAEDETVKNEYNTGEVSNDQSAGPVPTTSGTGKPSWVK